MITTNIDLPQCTVSDIRRREIVNHHIVVRSPLEGFPLNFIVKLNKAESWDIGLGYFTVKTDTLTLQKADDRQTTLWQQPNVDLQRSVKKPAQGRFYVGGGAIAPKLRPCLNYDMKHCLTNSKHQHIGAKRSVMWPLKYAKMRFPPWLRPGPHQGSLRRLPCSLVAWGWGTPSHTSLDSPPSALATQRLIWWGGALPSQIFSFFTAAAAVKWWCRCVYCSVNCLLHRLELTTLFCRWYQWSDVAYQSSLWYWLSSSTLSTGSMTKCYICIYLPKPNPLDTGCPS